MNSISTADFPGTFRGKVIKPGDADYDNARKVYNGMIDKHPALIAQCHDVADVIDCVNFGRNHNMRISIRGGGHNAGGLGICDDALVIDLSPMKGIHIDMEKKTVLVQGGWTRNYWDALHPHSAGGAYVNFMMDEGEDRVKATYGANYEKLSQVKRKYDPSNFFSVNQNIKPALV